MAETLPYSRYLPGLLLCLTLFVFRVLAQLLQFLHPVSFLPPFESWQSGALPYRWLLCSQILIVAGFSLIVRGFVQQSTIPRIRVGRWFVGFGSIYFGAMTVRLISGLTVAQDHPWFGAKVPALFHLVLAAFLLLFGHFHLKYGNES